MTSAMLDRVHALFMHDGVRRVLYALRVPLVLALALVFLWRLDSRWLWLGTSISLVGELVQLWCFANLSKKAVVASTGPYALVRNPMYLGRYLIVLGVVVLSGSLVAIVAYTVVYAFYMVNRVRREETTLKPLLGAPYADYCASVRRFVPGRPYRGNPVLTWNWQQFRRNHGGWNLLATIGFWVAAAAVTHWRHAG
jgi:protein-S-isoprenylcysteine O-methyltransferase Ste14